MLALEQTEEALAEIKIEDYEEILFIRKSIGTAAAAASEKADWKLFCEKIGEWQETLGSQIGRCFDGIY